MKCPICPDVDLIMTERQSVEIDYCPKCRGVWLDRGELDKIIERSLATQTNASDSSMPSQGPPPIPRDYHDHDDDRDHDDHHKHGHQGDDYRKHGQQGYRRKSWLSDLFD